MSGPSKKKSRPISRSSAPRLRREERDRAGVPMAIEFEPDSTSVTALATPAPLPPTPGADDQEEWLDQVPTNPDRIPDLGALAGRSDTSIPGWARAQRNSSKPGDIKPVPPGPPSPAPPSAPAPAPQPAISRALLVLIAAVFLTVGMVLGALMQDRLVHRPDACPNPAAHQ